MLKLGLRLWDDPREEGFMHSSCDKRYIDLRRRSLRRRAAWRYFRRSLLRCLDQFRDRALRLVRAVRV